MSDQENGDPFWDSICYALSKCSNLRFLQLYESLLSTNGYELQAESDDIKAMVRLLSKLDGLCFYDTDEEIANILLHHMSDKLVSLHFACRPMGLTAVNGFSELKEVCIFGADDWNISNITKTAKNLKRILLEFSVDCIHDGDEQTRQNLEDILVEALNQHKLEYISIEMDGDSEIIHNALQRMSITKRERMRFRIRITEQIEQDALSRYYELMRNKLEMNCDDYVFRFECVLTESMMTNNNDNVSFDGYAPGDKVWLIARNKNCKLNGYVDKWIYPCLCNELHQYCSNDKNKKFLPKD